MARHRLLDSLSAHSGQRQAGLRLLVFVILLPLALTVASGYRPDHGFLGELNVCAQHPPVTLRVPPNSQPVPNPLFGEYSGGFFHVGEISDGVFYITEASHQAMFLVSDEGIILVDAPPLLGINATDPSASVNIVDIIFSIQETQGKRIEKMIYSHSHIDHIGAASVVQDAFPDVEIIAHHETKQQLRRGTGSFGRFVAGVERLPPPLPHTTFHRQKRVRLGRQLLELSYKGPIHEPGNIFIYAPRQKVLMIVDLVAAGISQFPNLALAEDVPLFIKGHELALELDFEVYLGGHINRLGTRADVEEAKAYVEDIRSNAITALNDPSLFAIFNVVVDPNPPFQPFPAPLGVANPLGAVNIFLDQVACQCANLTLDPERTPSGIAWLERLATADISTVKHCFTMAEALRDDPSF